MEHGSRKGFRQGKHINEISQELAIHIYQPGDEIRIERDLAYEPSSNKAEKKASAKKESKAKGGKKQLSIATMFKPAPPKPATNKKKQDIVVRLTTMRGFGMLDFTRMAIF